MGKLYDYFLVRKSCENDGPLHLKTLAALETPDRMSISCWVSVPVLLLYTCKFDCRRKAATESYCGIDHLAPALFLVFEGCPLIVTLPPQKPCGSWLWHRKTLSCSFKVFLKSQFLFKCLKDWTHSPSLTLGLNSCPSKPSAFQLFLPSCHQSFNLSPKPTLRRVSGTSCILQVYSPLNWSIDGSFLLMVPDPLSLSMAL